MFSIIASISLGTVLLMYAAIVGLSVNALVNNWHGMSYTMRGLCIFFAWPILIVMVTVVEWRKVIAGLAFIAASWFIGTVAFSVLGML